MSLSELYLTGNKFSGNLESISMSNLSYLSIGHNRFFGTIPFNLFSEKSYNYIDISVNRFTGFFDFDILPLTNFSILRASVNRFSGRFNTASMNKFYEVEALSGNVVSCVKHYPKETAITRIIIVRQS